MKVFNWEEIQEANGGSKLPAGGYVAVITGVNDDVDKECMWIQYDIAEGEYKGHYSDEFAKNNPYIHQFSRSYKEAARGFFKSFLLRLDESNPAFDYKAWSATGDENKFIGLQVGIVCQYEKYNRKSDGAEKERLNVVDIVSVDNIRKGDYKLPPVADKRENVIKADAQPEPQVQSTDNYADVPF